MRRNGCNNEEEEEEKRRKEKKRIIFLPVKLLLFFLKKLMKNLFVIYLICNLSQVDKELLLLLELFSFTPSSSSLYSDDFYKFS